jgi:hypothetical protein
VRDPRLIDPEYELPEMSDEEYLAFLADVALDEEQAS